MFSNKTLVLFTTLSVAMAGAASAATVVALPDTSQETTFSATVSEQATVTVPATVGFGTITNVGANKDSSAQSVSATSIILADGNSLKVSLKANTASFTTTGTGTTYSAGDVSWNAPTWTGGTGASHSLNPDTTTYAEVATSTANAATLSTATLVFTLAANTGVTQAGLQSLVATWKFESI